ncbi:hypothetical protein [Sulfurimonas sp.]|uniref:hypothetical protein n=1 Tax=Sulfurimonas sp. TaxID=2022749 RepID=UPI002AB0DE41|nr:hypothetical protein [Sulfurimonas sp.]
MKEIKTIKALAEYIGKSEATVHNWKKTNPELHEIIMGFLENDKKCPDFESSEYMVNEITNDLKKLPLGQIKILYYTIKTKLAELGH